MAISNSLHNLKFEMDSKTLVTTLQALNVPCNVFGDLVFECKILLSSNPDYAVSFIKRQKNMVAHNIVRTDLSHPSPHIFHDVSSTWYPLIISEMQ